MERQTLIFTALPHRMDGPLAPGNTMRLSVFITPRLWTKDTNVKSLTLAQFPDFLDWPEQVGKMKFHVEFDGVPAFEATPKFNLNSTWWKALFKTTTLVLPYNFADDDCSGAELEVLPVTEIHDTLRDVYRRVGTDPGYGAGKKLPSVEVLASDRDLKEIARPTEPARPYEGPPPEARPVPIKPEPGYTPPCPRPRGCLCWVWLALLLRCLCCCRPRRLSYWIRLGLCGLLWAKLCRLFRSRETTIRRSTLPAARAAAAGDAGETVLRSSSAALTKSADAPISSSNQAVSKSAAFNQLIEFVKPFDEKFAAMPTAEELKNEYDFHKMVSLLGDYPALLRPLGLVVDLEVPFSSTIPTTPDAAVRVLVTWTPLLPATISYNPRTHYILEADRFLLRPRPAEPELSNGLLKLNDKAGYRVIQVDAVGGGLKLANTATNLTWQKNPLNPAQPPNIPDDAGIPALRTGGISLVRPGHRDDLIKQFGFQALFNAALAKVEDPPAGAPPEPPAELFAEDVTRGYRIDVFDDKSKRWHSLCQRFGHYHFLDGPIEHDEHDEGFVQFGATEQLTPHPTRLLRATESLFTWDGWSLSAPRPGKSLQVDGSSAVTENKAATNFRLETSFDVEPKSLPRLRYGWTYRLRARAVDLAGHSVFEPKDPAFSVDPPEATPPFVFNRFEPVSPPALVLRAVPKEGESLERMVVRSVPLAPAAIVPAERHVVPPKIALSMAEQHEKLDDKPTMKRDQTGYDLAAREAGSLTHKLVGSALQKMAGIVQVVEPQPPPATATAQPLHTFWLQTQENFELAYLPDVLARGVLFRGLPGVNSEDDVIDFVNRIGFDGAWPHLNPFRIQLVGITSGKPAAPNWDPIKRVLRVEILAGKTKTVLFNSQMSVADLPQKGVWNWIEEEPPADLETLKNDAAVGRQWLETPYRQLVLVHAVQQPLAIPEVVNLTLTKEDLGETSVALTGSVTIHRATTGKIDLLAEWADPFDNPAKSGFDEKTDLTPQTMHVCEVIASATGGSKLDLHETKPEPIRQNFGDTKYHRVTYRAEATTRFREYFPFDQANITRPGTGEAPLTITRDVQNSARPDAPRIVYVIPAFHWNESETHSGGIRTLMRERRGNGLRVYLERPWYSSGWDERLGVVFAIGKPFQDLAENLRPLVTQWGRDPIWDSGPLPVSASFENFDSFLEKEEDVPLDELPGEVVAVVGYRAEFDSTRALWFADIELLKLGESYSPFVRLALARYQPHSFPGAQLSRISRADFVQLPPDRHTTVAIKTQSAKTLLDVAIKGPIFKKSSATLGALPPGKVQFTIERRNPQLTGDLAWEPVDPTEYDVKAMSSPPGPLLPLTAQITIKNPAVPQDFRLVIKEFENIRSDLLEDTALKDKGETHVAERLIYADVFEL